MKLKDIEALVAALKAHGQMAQVMIHDVELVEIPSYFKLSTVHDVDTGKPIYESYKWSYENAHIVLFTPDYENK